MESNEQTSASKTPPRRRPRLSPPAYVLNKHDSRVLDPDQAVAFAGQTVRPTVYVGAELIANYGAFTDEMRTALADAAGEKLKLEVTLPDERMLEFAKRNDIFELAQRVLTVRVKFVPADENAPMMPPDAWTILQHYRSTVGRNSDAANAVTLNHLMMAADIEGAPKMVGSGIDGAPKMVGSGAGGAPKMVGSGVSPANEYAFIGYGGRQPVDWIGPGPHRTSDAEVAMRSGRRPVVAVLDTGAGCHWWLPDDVVDRAPKAGSHFIGLTDPATNPELTGILGDPLEGMIDSDAGHGTFIAGLIRQTCPDANILAVRIMYGDGAVKEQDLLDALNWLLLRHAAAQQSGDVSQLIDVISMSIGYYHESPADVAFDQQLLLPLRELTQRGVAVVAAAGNDATTRHFYPAGFAPHPASKLGIQHDAVPLVSVGAKNPNGKTTALFSNDGDWVVAQRPGASVLSTLPTTFDGALDATARLRIPGYGIRETIDPDDFRGGFAVWSGTSFATPILAGEIAQSLLEIGGLDKPDAESALSRTWEAITATTGLARP